MRPGVQLSTVTTPAASYNLVDLASCKTRMSIADGSSDATLNLLIADASAAAIRYTANPIVVETRQDLIWPWRDGRLGALRSAADALKLKRWPLIAVTSVVETIGTTATTLVAGTDFLADNDNGELIRLDDYGAPRPWRATQVAVAYTAGYAAVPSDVQEAICEMVKARFYARGRDPAIKSENVEGVLQTSYWFGAGSESDDMPPLIQGKLERYRVPVLP